MFMLLSATEQISLMNEGDTRLYVGNFLFYVSGKFNVLYLREGGYL
jgi:hypothetical protein